MFVSTFRDLQKCIRVFKILISALVNGVSVIPNDTTVTVSWTPVNLPGVDHYTVYYGDVTTGELNETVTFPASASSEVVSGLQEGQQYQFSVSVSLNVNGILYTGRECHSYTAVEEVQQMYICSIITD